MAACRFCKQLFGQLLIALAFTGLSQCTKTDEINANQVEVRFDGIYSIESWDDAKTNGFVDTTTAAVNTYCASNLADCQLQDPSSFTVVLSSSSPEYFNGDIKMTFHVELPVSGVVDGPDPQYVLEKAVVVTIMRLNDTITAVDNATGETLMVIDGERLTPIDYSLDVIMIPVACCLFLLVVVLALCLNCMQSRKDKKKEQAMMAGSGKKGEEGITLTAVKNDTADSATTVDDSTTTHPKAAKKFRRVKKPKAGREPRDNSSTSQVTPELYTKNPPKGIEVQPALPKDSGSNFSTNNSNDLVATRRAGSRHGIELPPLIAPVGTPRGLSMDGSSDSEDKDRKKEKRKKKHSRQTSQQTLVDAEGGSDNNNESLTPHPEPTDHKLRQLRGSSLE